MEAAEVNAPGCNSVGGLVAINRGIISNCYVTGNIMGHSQVGGLAGTNDTLQADSDMGIIFNCYTTGNVSGDHSVGGLVGMNNDKSTISNSYSQCNVSGNYNIGGLVGGNEGTISNCYAAGAVNGTEYIGGLVGLNDETISNCYAAGAVDGDDDTGGLVGYNDAGAVTVSDSFWDTITTLQSSSDGGTGKTTSEMKDVATFTEIDTPGLSNPWDFVDDPNDDAGTDDIWSIDATGSINSGYPYLTGLQP